ETRKFFTRIFISISSRNGGLWTRTLLSSHVAMKDVQQRNIHEVSGDVIPINMVKGIGHLRDPRLNKKHINVKRTQYFNFLWYIVTTEGSNRE
ncbi:hypothetical protein ALC53_10933, partial [Atta colombica]